MHRFYIDRVEDNRAIISDTGQRHHIKDVLRLKINDEVSLSDAEGNDYTGVITGIDRKQVVMKVKRVKSAAKPTVKLTVACAIPKGGRMDEAIDHLTQLGVARIIPVLTERVVVKLDVARAEVRLKRWTKIAQSAARQCQRSDIPVVSPVTKFEDVVLNSQNYDLKLIPHLSGKRRLIKDVLAECKPENIIVLIGPEGDFTPPEVTLALHNGFTPLSLGDTVLRVATAAIAVTAYIKFAIGE